MKLDLEQVNCLNGSFVYMRTPFYQVPRGAVALAVFILERPSNQEIFYFDAEDRPNWRIVTEALGYDPDTLKPMGESILDCPRDALPTAKAFSQTIFEAVGRYLPKQATLQNMIEEIWVGAENLYDTVVNNPESEVCLSLQDGSWWKYDRTRQYKKYSHDRDWDYR